MKKTYIVDWTNKTRRGWRDYRKVVETDNIAEYVKGKMKLHFGVVCGKGMFRSATEVVKSERFGYAWKEVKGGEYWFTRDTSMLVGEITWVANYFDYKLKSWMVG